MTFQELGLHESLLEAISYMGFEKATPIQEQTMPIILNGDDLIACAQTGTGKTAAFLLPILHKLASKNSHKTSTLIVVPTRELALQIDQEIQGFSYFLGINSIAIYGGGDGADFDQQRKALSSNTEIIVATPGKLISHLNLGYVKFDHVEHLILDEADRMLDMGFYEDIQKIISHLPNKRQNLMFSATMPPKIRELASKTLVNPKQVSIAISKPSEGVLQAAYLVEDPHKPALIRHLLRDKPNYSRIIIFSSTKRQVNEIVRTLSGENYTVEGISSDLDQKEREEIINRFRSNKTRVVVATDVLSRGVDIKEINLVINFNVPGDGEDYVHRIGRTARADSTGVAITLVNSDEMFDFHQIEKLIEKDITKQKIPTQIGISPEWNPTRRKQNNFGRSKSGSKPANNRPKPNNNAKPQGSSGDKPKKKFFKKKKTSGTSPNASNTDK